MVTATHNIMQETCSLGPEEPATISCNSLCMNETAICLDFKSNL